MAETATTAVANTWIDRYARFCLSAVDGASLAVFRVCFGALLCLHVIHQWRTGLIKAHFITPLFHFGFFPFITPPPGDGIYWVYGAVFVGGAMLVLGKLPRVACALAAVCMTYIFLLDRSYYLNHIYLVCLVSFLLTLMPTGKSVPRWCLLILRFQFALVYFFAGIAKINADWLAGHPLEEWLLDSINNRALWPIVRNHSAVVLMCQGGLLIDLTAGFLLSFRRTFWLGAMVTVPFHLANALLFQIGIFPWLMLASTGIYAQPNWPRCLLEKVSALYGRFFKKMPGWLVPDASPSGDAEPLRTSFQKFVVCGVLPVFVAMQLLLPLRHFLYPGETAWSEEGHRFAWRMMLHSKRVEEFRILMSYPGSDEIVEVNPLLYATANQMFNVATFPDLMLQFAHFIADDQEKRTGKRPAVHFVVRASLNGHEAQNLIDPNVDLASIKPSFKHAEWIVPLRN